MELFYEMAFVLKFCFNMVLMKRISVSSGSVRGEQGGAMDSTHMPDSKTKH